ncbi:MAG TPA: DNA polymerase IV [Candidatus Polarisedimenticolia bacterium]|nr:DNA polymerase IV [Candidatus Polarisedimenticolia bacterium]
MLETRSQHVVPAPQARPRTAPRKVIHVDMDAYFASVEQLDHPELKGLPVAVGGNPRERGVVAAASYEARRFGVRSAMPAAQALRLCPDLVLRPPRFVRYVEISRQVIGILKLFSPLVEAASLDEAYLDVSAAPESAGTIAAAIKSRIREEVGLTASAGVGPSKLVAKIASDLGKPDGLVIVKPAHVRSFLAPLPVGRLWGVGPVTDRKLAAMGLLAIGDLARASEDRVRARLGPAAVALIRLARGEDDRPVTPHHKTRSISCERTLTEDTRDIPTLDHHIDRFAGDVAAALRDEGSLARTVVLKVRYADFALASRSRTLRTPFNDADTIAREARALLVRAVAGRRRVRLIGVGVSGLLGAGEPAQRPLFGSP